MKKKVSVIIVNWNGKKYLKSCLKSLFDQTYPNLEVILVDNDSLDGSIEFTQTYYPQVKIIKNRKNLGFAQGNNIGYRNSSGDYVLFLNNDTKVTKKFLDPLVKYLDSRPLVGAIQSKILLLEKKGYLDSVGAFLTWTGFLYHFGVSKKDLGKYNKEITIFSAKGACMMFKREILEKVKVDGEIFDGRYFAYFEETDLCHRVWLAGYKIVFLPSSVIYHVMGATSSKLDEHFIQYHSFKNRINSYVKNLEFINLCKMLTLHLLFLEAYAIGSFSLKIFFALNKAIVWNITSLKETLQKRRFIQKNIRRKKDYQLFPLIMKNVGISYYFDLSNGLKNYEDSISI